MAYPPCKKCDPAGLKILPTLYSVLPSTVQASLPDGISGDKVIGNTLSEEHHYGLRIMREGYLYLIYTKGPKGKNYAEGYRVIADGTVQPLPIPTPLVMLPEPRCGTTGHGIRASTITIQDASDCGEIFIAFAEHRWSDDALKLYLGNMDKRRDRMQSFFPAQWIKSGKHEHAVEATQANIEKVVEYSPAFRTPQLEPDEHTLGKLSNVDGTYSEAKLKTESTRYPVHQRFGQAKDVAAFMKDASVQDGGKPAPPMLLALWDGIGITHELAGFRNDAGSMLALYVQERAAQIDAVECIRGAKAAKEADARATAARRHSGDLQNYKDTQTRWNDYIKDPVAKAQAQARSDAAVKSFQERNEGVIKVEQDQEVKFVDEKWASSYQTLLLKGQPDTFAGKFETFQDAIGELQGKRVEDLNKWLHSPLFLSTLRDYHECNLGDGKAFAAVVEEALLGLNSEAKGAAVVEAYVNLDDATKDESLVWRAFAYNQKEPKEAVKELLQQAVEHKATLMEQISETAETIKGALEKFKTFFDMMEKMGEVHEHENPISATERFVKDKHADRLILTIGNALFKWTGLGKFGDCMGSYLVRGALFARVGVSKEDTQSLVKWAAKVDPEMRKALHDGYAARRAQSVPSAQAFARTVQDLADNDDGKLYRAKMSNIKLTGGAEGEQMSIGLRLGGTLAAIELINFGCTLAKNDKSFEGRAELVASGFSAIGTCLLASTKLMTSFGKDGVERLANLKALSGYFGGASAAIGMFLDAGKAVDSLNKGKYTLMGLYTIKGLIGFGVASSNFLTALTNSAPLIARIAGKGNVAWIGKVKSGIEGAAAASEKMAATAGDAAARKLAAQAAGNLAFDATAEEVGVVVGERATLLLIGRGVLFLAGWEVMVVVTFIQVTIWIFSDNDLQTWLRQCAFGVDAKKDWEASKQHEAFEKALESVGLEMKEGAE